MSRLCHPRCVSIGRIRRLEARVAVLEALVASLGGDATEPDPEPAPAPPAPARPMRARIDLSQVPSEMEKLADSWRRR